MKEYIEKYLESVYVLSIEHNGVRIADLAKELNVTKPSITFAVKKLKAMDLVNQVRYGKIFLTDKGRSEAEKIYRKHVMIVEFLYSVLDIDRLTAEKNAHTVEHVMSKDLVNAIEKYLDFNEISFDIPS